MFNYIIAFSCVIATSIIGSLFTTKNTNSKWYQCIKPSITPPNIVFPIVWTILYILIGVAFSITIKNRSNILNFLISITLILNIVWSYLYFGKKQISTAFIIILFMDLIGILLIGISIYYKQNKIAYLLTPYVIWILFASVLNYLSIEKAKKCTVI